MDDPTPQGGYPTPHRLLPLPPIPPPSNMHYIRLGYKRANLPEEWPCYQREKPGRCGACPKTFLHGNHNQYLSGNPDSYIRNFIPCQL